MENRIKEQQLDLFADRTSAATMRVSVRRIRVSLSSVFPRQELFAHRLSRLREVASG